MKYFCTSDVHSHGKLLKEELKRQGYDKENPEHTLVVLGDIFDRGDDTLETYEFLKSIPEDRLVLIRGNHEYLFCQLLDARWPEEWDFSNGTVKTFCHIAGVTEDVMEKKYWFRKAAKEQIGPDITSEWVRFNLNKAWADIKEKVRNSEITRFLLSDRWVNYFELDDYVFVHAFVPMKVKKKFSKMNFQEDYQAVYDEFGDYHEYDPKWRENNGGTKSTDLIDETKGDDWTSAVWKVPYEVFKKGLFKEDKTLVVGHRATEYFFQDANDLNPEYNVQDGESVNEYISRSPIFKTEKLIGLDGGTYWTGNINVLVIDN